MKQKAVYSRATGAVIVFAALLFFVCVDSGTWMRYALERFNSFGKTHFIVGYSSSSDQTSSASDTPHTRAGGAARSGLRRVLFSPDDDVRKELIALIDAETKRIRIAIFTFTDKQVAQALLHAHKRGVAIEMIVDNGYVGGQHSKIAWLQRHKIPVFTYNPQYKNLDDAKEEIASIMHNKFVIFGDKKNQALVWTGSFNFTRSATERNQENVVILDDWDVIERYAQQFERLKHRCDDCHEDDKKLQPTATVIG